MLLKLRNLADNEWEIWELSEMTKLEKPSWYEGYTKTPSKLVAFKN